MVDVCDVPVVSEVCDTAGDAAASLVTAPFDWLATAMGGAAQWMFESVWKAFDTTTYVDVTGGEFTKVYRLLFGVAIFVMLAFFMLQVIGGMIRREPAALSRAVLGLAKSVLGSFVALTLLATALELTDRLCIGIVNAAGTNMNQMGDRIAVLAAGLSTINLTAPGAGSIITIFLASIALGAALLVWISLLIRKALLLIAIVFAPIALAGATWDHTRAWVSRWLSFVLALILSKVVIVVILLLATAQVSAPIDMDLKSASEPISGVVLMLMAGFAPYIAYKAISFMGFDMYHAMSAEQEAKSALNRPLPLPLRRGGAEPPKVLGSPGKEGVGTPAGGSSPPATQATASTAGGSAAGAAFAGAGAATAGVLVAEKAAAAGPRLGRALGSAGHPHSNSAPPTQQRSHPTGHQTGRPRPQPPRPASGRLDDLAKRS